MGKVLFGLTLNDTYNNSTRFKQGVRQTPNLGMSCFYPLFGKENTNTSLSFLSFKSKWMDGHLEQKTLFVHQIVSSHISLIGLMK